MSKTKETRNQTANSNGGKQIEPIVERLPKDFEPDESPTAKAFMKAVRITRKRLYPKLYEAKKKRA